MTYTGVLKLQAKKKDQKTIISSCYYEGALKLTRPVYLEENSPSLYLIHVGGGYVDGDTYITSLAVEDGAELAVTTQSSTKVYRTPKKPVYQRMDVRLGKGSVLEFIPDPLIAYEGARFIQETSVQLEEESCLFFSDIITPGWAEDGSFFQYDWIRSKLKVFNGEKLLIFDHLMLEPDDEMAGMMQMDHYTHVGTFLIFHQKASKEFLDTLYETLADKFEEVRFGLSALPEGGLMVRILASNTGTIEKLIEHAHAFARKELLGKESVRWRKY